MQIARENESRGDLSICLQIGLMASGPGNAVDTTDQQVFSAEGRMVSQAWRPNCFPHSN